LFASSLGTGVVSLLLACQSSPPPSDEPLPGGSLRHLQTPGNATEPDADRAALSRLVGVWSFEGWSDQGGAARTTTAGRAAAAIENEHFVLLDLQTTSGQLAGTAAHKGGSMLFASEPGIGLTLTAWGDASPSITRLAGDVNPDASVFTFRELKTPPGRHRLACTLTFETDDRWVAEIRDVSEAARPVVARYVFTRAAQ
jgi:hypothetical protein